MAKCDHCGKSRQIACYCDTCGSACCGRCSVSTCRCDRCNDNWREFWELHDDPHRLQAVAWREMSRER